MSERTKTGRHDARVGGASERRMWSARVALVLGVLSCTLTACSTRTGKREILPWFTEQTSFFKFGGFAETPNSRTYSARHFGFLWLPVDASSAVALSDAAVLLDRGVKGKSVLVRGAFASTPVCPMSGEVSVPPSTATVDCLLVNADSRWNGPGYRKLEVRRTSFDGNVVYDKTIEVADSGHAFKKFNFYDKAGSAYFLAVSVASLNDKHAAPDCMLLRGFGKDTRIAARRPDISDLMQCFRPESWKEQVGPMVAHWDTIKYPGSHADPRR